MAMFDDSFSFSTRSPSFGSSTTGTRESSRSVSPFSSAVQLLPSPCFSVTDLAAQFADQRIRREAPICYDSCEAYANNDDDAGWSIPAIEDDEECRPLSRARTFPQRPHSPSRRSQRQLNTRLLCTASHHRDIAALVSRMVRSQDQCIVTPPGSTTPTREVEHEDEGYSSTGDGPMEMSTARRSSMATTHSRPEFRRSSSYLSSGACVSKAIRLRKDGRNPHRRLRSSEKSS